MWVFSYNILLIGIGIIPKILSWCKCIYSWKSYWTINLHRNSPPLTPEQLELLDHAGTPGLANTEATNKLVTWVSMTENATPLVGWQNGNPWLGSLAKVWDFFLDFCITQCLMPVSHVWSYICLQVIVNLCPISLYIHELWFWAKILNMSEL